ncbi:hypothetical protein CHGG_09837 [Chaetomium globosum CBS 148.51]|uniref:Glucose N-acetyltransferase 1 n=1 Tax=Chaetomium globosum (strain ATCC 6205 / CBS 148.51 / DSM 1962 / NBRC 6347 / NRRL 1970) TaxID=306901 RepID=Q2GQB7_CHAGB|nr:uncharacterized protein CHGG_09837 [Chaetomium globosum CBS 148.51]EAQ83433.1 hypothetical protein CHGG_09837 [Chaetomium globosum CBS 148.51]
MVGAVNAQLTSDSTAVKVTNILSSRKLRLLLPITLILSVFVVFGHRYDALPRIPATWSQGSDSKPVDDTESVVDWSQFAYTQYVTNSQYLCNSVMLLERLQNVGSRADRVIMYPSYMLDQNAASISPDGRLLIKARDEYGAKLVPIQVQSRRGGDTTWAESFTKLLAFNQTQYKRVLSLDSDSVVLQSMDELFLLPSCPIAMPRAYWLYPDTKILSSQLVLVEPSEREFSRVMAKVDVAGRDDYDMEIVNYLYGDTALVLPHRRISAGESEVWDPVAVFNEAKFLHFSDWPVPKAVVGDGEDAGEEAAGVSCAGRDGILRGEGFVEWVLRGLYGKAQGTFLASRVQPHAQVSSLARRGGHRMVAAVHPKGQFSNLGRLPSTRTQQQLSSDCGGTHEKNGKLGGTLMVTSAS